MSGISLITNPKVVIDRKYSKISKILGADRGWQKGLSKVTKLSITMYFLNP